MRSRASRQPVTPAARPGRLPQWWLDRPVRAKGLIVLALPLMALIAVTVASLILQHNERQERPAAVAASELSVAAGQTLAGAVNAETSIRGYAATGQTLFLTPYSAARRSISSSLTCTCPICTAPRCCGG